MLSTSGVLKINNGEQIFPHCQMLKVKLLKKKLQNQLSQVKPKSQQ